MQMRGFLLLSFLLVFEISIGLGMFFVLPEKDVQPVDLNVAFVDPVATDLPEEELDMPEDIVEAIPNETEFASSVAVVAEPDPYAEPQPIVLADVAVTPQGQLLEPPEIIQAVYLTSWSASTASRIDYIINLAKTTEVNAVVIDIKDYSGFVMYDVKVPEVARYGGKNIRIKNIDSLVEKLHKEGIYVIARITVFQDPVLAQARPDLAVHSIEKMKALQEQSSGNDVGETSEEVEIVTDENSFQEDLQPEASSEGGSASGGGQPLDETEEIDELIGNESAEVSSQEEELRTTATLWLDHKGLAWINPAAKEAWNYTVAIARDAASRGFDELNFDYIRFPSDGVLSDMEFPGWDLTIPRHVVLKEFFSYLRNNVSDIAISADLFGLSTSLRSDLGIGQIIEDAYEYFDYVYPMVYPSHYSDTFLGHPKPAEYPYEVVSFSMEQALARLKVLRENLGIAESEVEEFVEESVEESIAEEESGEVGSAQEETVAEKPKVKRLARLRPWLQDFDLGANYDTLMVQAQIQATKDAMGEDYVGYLMWAPTNIYTIGALQPFEFDMEAYQGKKRTTLEELEAANLEKEEAAKEKEDTEDAS